MELIKKYFPNLLPNQIHQFSHLKSIYEYWNTSINLLSRKTFDKNNFYQNHVLFSLGLSKVKKFYPGEYVMDLGTGGGFPGIPLSILFPQTNFLLVDSIKKKIKIVKRIISYLHLKNVFSMCIRAEKIEDKFDVIVTRSVTKIPVIHTWIKNKFTSPSPTHSEKGSLYLKGGNIDQEIKLFPHAKEYPLNHYFKEPFFITKKVVWIPNNKKSKLNES